MKSSSESSLGHRILESLRQNFLRNLGFGLLTLIPVFGSLYVFFVLLGFSDRFLFNLLPEQLQPHNLFGFEIPGLGIFLTVSIIYGTGAFARNYLGKKILDMLENVLKRIPGMNSLYSAFRQITESIFMDRSQAFRKVVLIQFPVEGTYTLAFVTSIAKNSSSDKTAYNELYTVFVPTTPNPTSGFFMVIPNTDVVDVNVSVQEAFRLIVSGGMLAASTDIVQRMEIGLLPALQRRRRREAALEKILAGQA